MLAIKLISILALLFAGGLATSFAEYKFQYSLYKLVFRVK